jgi:hypothetical protein
VRDEIIRLGWDTHYLTLVEAIRKQGLAKE